MSLSSREPKPCVFSALSIQSTQTNAEKMLRSSSSSSHSSLLLPSSGSVLKNKASPPLPVLSKTRSSSYPTVRCSSNNALLQRRNHVIGLVLGVCTSFVADHVHSAGLPPEEKPRLCDADCEKQLENVPMVTTESGLQYKDIELGTGPNPPVGFQVAANYVAMVPSGQIFDSSLEKGLPYIFRVGSGQVIKGLDEGILTMKTGGKRRLYIPGTLAFPKGLNSAPGRPRVAASSPVIFDVSLEYIPGLEADEE